MSMKINATLPFDRIDAGGEFVGRDAILECSATLERAGFWAGCVTDHPVPTGRWLDSGGHHAPDPFALLGMVAAATTTLRLQTGILVLPYRNPFLTARAVATLDVFSAGRVILGLGAGYLKGEYRALGVDFDRRNEIMDEYLAAMKAAWGAEEFAFAGTGYDAPGNRILPLPVQRPHPPLLLGGNSRRAIRRAVEFGDAWNPFFNAPVLAATSRTAVMSSDEELAQGIAYLSEQSAAAGRATPPEIVLGSITRPGEKLDYAAFVDRVGEQSAMGVSAAGVHIEGRSRAEWCDNVERFGAEVITKLG